MSVLPVGFGSAVNGGFNVERSLRFNSADSAYLNRTPASASNRKTYTFSFWAKRSALGTRQNFFSVNSPSSGNNGFSFEWLDTNSIGVYFDDGVVSPTYIGTTPVYRDSSSWYHIVLAVDATQATSGDRVKIYVNGVSVAYSFLFGSSAITNANTLVNSTSTHNIGVSQRGTSTRDQYLNGYLTEFNFIDGQQLTPSSFGETDSNTGVWKPKAFSGTYGTNGFYLPFKTASQWSGYFDGTGDYLTVANNAALNFGTSAFTVECWFYRTSSAAVYGLWSLNSVTSGYAGARAQINTNGSIDVYISQNGSSWANSITNLGSTTVNTWNHLAVVRESNGNIKIYINGTQAGTTVTNANSLYAGTSHLIGGVYSAGSPSSVFPGYISNFRSVVGTAVYTGNFTPPTSQLTAVTNTQLLTCQSSTFVDNSANALTITAAGDSRPQQFSPFTLDVTDDHSGTGNHWQPNNLDLRTTGAGADILVDSPTSYGTDTGAGGEVRGNYATLNPLAKGAGVVLSDGNLGYTSNATYRVVLGSIAVASGKYYWEVTAPSNAYAFGVADVSYKIFDSSILATGNLFSYSSFSGDKYIGLSFTQSSYDTSGGISTSTVLGFAVDFDTGTATIYRNGVSKGVIHTWTPGATYAPFAGYDTTPSGVAYFNFGQRAFAYTAPSGFKALCTQNLPTPAIGATSTTQAGKYFNVKTWTATGARNVLTGVGFQPDLLWGKKRSAADSNVLVDVARGVTKELYSDATTAETTNVNGVESFDSDGFTLVGSGSGSGVWNGNTGATHVAWAWKANGAGSSNTSGTITSTVSANTTSGFSIVTYTGTGANATVGHGLGVAPAMIIVKRRGTTGNWPVYHTSLGNAQGCFLNLTNAANSQPNLWNSTTPTSTVFSLGADAESNGTTTIVAYCFAAVAGYSAFGSYTGNGNADGPFVYTGFRPRYVMIKRTDSADNWYVKDTARDSYNPTLNILIPNSSSAEIGNQQNTDFLSNGFKIRTTDGAINASGGTYIYMALAENPFKYSLAR